MLDQAILNASANSFTRIAGTAIEGNDKNGDGLGGTKPDASSKDGLGGAGMLELGTGGHCIWIGAFALMALL